MDIEPYNEFAEKSFPYHKVPSTLDIGLPESTQDSDYLTLLQNALPKIFAFHPDIVFYIAGVDPLREDRYGKLSLTENGLARRDTLVLSECLRHNVPVSLVLGGGYAVPIDHTIRAHIQTFKIAKEIFGI